MALMREGLSNTVDGTEVVPDAKNVHKVPHMKKSSVGNNYGVC